MPMNMRWTIYLKALVVKLIDSSFVKQQPNLEYFRLFVHLEDFTPHGCSLKKNNSKYLLTVSYTYSGSERSNFILPSY